jgi:hypothetical protein
MPKRSTASRPSGSNGRAPKRARLSGSMGPRPIAANPQSSHTFRFTASGLTALPAGKAVSVETLLCAAGVIATTTVAGSAFHQAVKILSIEVWTPPAAQGSPATCSVLWSDSNFARNSEVSDTSVSTAEPAHVRTSPPAGTQAAFWNSSSNLADRLCTIVAPPGSIIDVTVSLIACDGGAASGVAVLVGGNVGRASYCALDNTTLASASYLPVSLTAL